jgi:hypothetical protein
MIRARGEHLVEVPALPRIVAFAPDNARLLAACSCYSRDLSLTAEPGNGI